MDSLITAAARALARGDLLGALNRLALRDDAPGLALQGIILSGRRGFQMIVSRRLKLTGMSSRVWVCPAASLSMTVSH